MESTQRGSAIWSYKKFGRKRFNRRNDKKYGNLSYRLQKLIKNPKNDIILEIMDINEVILYEK